MTQAMRKSKTPTVTAFLIVEPRPADCQLIVWVEQPKPTVDPVVKAQASHSFLRPFDIATLDGRPFEGDVRYVMLDPGGPRPCRVLASVCTPPPRTNAPGGPRFHDRRLLIYPGWGDRPLIPVHARGATVPHPVHHITIEEDPNGNVSMHLTAYDQNRRKVRYAETAKLPKAELFGLPLFTLIVGRPDALDVAGTVRRNIPTPKSTPRRPSPAALESELGAGLRLEHPVIGLPDGAWGPNEHLQASFIISDQPLTDQDYGKRYVTDPTLFDTGVKRKNQQWERIVPLQLANGSNLLIALTKYEGSPKGAINLVNWRA